MCCLCVPHSYKNNNRMNLYVILSRKTLRFLTHFFRKIKLWSVILNTIPSTLHTRNFILFIHVAMPNRKNSYRHKFFWTPMAHLMCISNKRPRAFLAKKKLTMFPKGYNLRSKWYTKFLPFQLEDFAWKGGCTTYLPSIAISSLSTFWYFFFVALGLSIRNLVSIFFILELSSSIHNHPLLAS